MAVYLPTEKQVYHGISSFYQNSDSSISVDYKLGIFLTRLSPTETGESIEEQYFEELSTQNFYIDSYSSQEILSKPLTKEDIGKTPNEITISRIEEYLRNTNQIKL